MDTVDRDRILELVHECQKIRRLYLKHREIERKLSKLIYRGYLTSAEYLETKQLKRDKLKKADEMMELLRARGLSQAA